MYSPSADLVNNSGFGHSTPLQMLNNNPSLYDTQLQLQILQQQHQQLLLQQQLQLLASPQQHQQQTLMLNGGQLLSPPMLSPPMAMANNLRNILPANDPVLLAQIYQAQIQLQLQQQQQQQQQLFRSQLESPFLPIQQPSPLPEAVSPLSQQKSPLNVALYLPAAENLTRPEQASSSPKRYGQNLNQS
jgi:hypothetical protein